MSTTLYQRAFSLSQAFRLAHPISKYIPQPLISCLQTIAVWPLELRKFALTVTRVQKSPFTNRRLQLDVEDMTQDEFPNLRNPVTLANFTLNDVLSDLDFISTSPILCSVLSFAVRAEIMNSALYEEIRDTVVLKEIQAALLEDRPQALDYSALTIPGRGLFGDGPVKGVTTLDRWRDGVLAFKNMYADQEHIFIPHYNRRKNVGDETHMNFLQAQNGHNPLETFVTNDTKPSNLMVHYHETGEQITGAMEMRYALRYNDLKGRSYYASGGTSIFAGLFIKSIVKDLLNLLPSTHTYARYDARRVTWKPLLEGEVLLTYDYSSFTTSLAELKYFLVYLARQLQDVTIRVLDLHAGVKEYNLGSYIMEYNSTININAKFQAHRLDIQEMLFDLHQVKSGMLGAQGNIGFSTLNHGLSTSALNDDPDTTCVVGDDALLRVWRDYLALAISRAQSLCPIETSKFHVWSPVDWYTEEGYWDGEDQAWQFLKRPLNISVSQQVETGELPVYPNFAELVLPPDGYHTSSFDRSRCRLFLTFAKQWGRFLLHAHRMVDHLSEDEISSALIPIVRVYERYRIPLQGLPPGSDINIDGESMENIPNSIPPATIDAFYEDWVTLLCRSYEGSYMRLPVLVYQSVPIGPCHGLGHVVTGTMHRVQKIMGDLGYFDIRLENQVVEINEATASLLKAVVAGSSRSRMLYTFTCIKAPIPAWYNEIISDEGPVDRW